MTDEPTSHLTEPPSPQATIGDGYVNLGMIFDLISPSAWINETLKTIVGWDVLGYCSSFFAGDWESYARFGGALQQLAEFHQALGVKVQQGAIAADRDWHGNAADGAYMYFSDLASATSGQQIPLREISGDYDEAARGVWMTAQQVQGLVQAALDKAIIAGVSAAAGTVTAKTVVGPIVGYAVAAWQVIDIINLINRASTLMQTAITTIQTVAGTILARTNVGGDLSNFPLPQSTYDHPAVS